MRECTDARTNTTSRTRVCAADGRTRHLTLACICAFCIRAFLAPSAVHAEVIDRVLAVVAGQLITLTDVTAAIDLGLESPDGAADPVRAVLSKLIDRELVLAEVDRYAPPEPTTAATDGEVARVRARFASDAAFEAALARSGIDVAHLRGTMRDELRIQAYLDQRFTVQPPTEDEIGKYYREHAAEFTRGGATMTFEAARPEIVQALAARARQSLVSDWITGLRRRAEITDLYLTGR